MAVESTRVRGRAVYTGIYAAGPATVGGGGAGVDGAACGELSGSVQLIPIWFDFMGGTDGGR